MHAKRLTTQLVTSLFGLGLLAAAPAAKAELIGTQQLTQQTTQQTAGAQGTTLTQDRQTLNQFLARADVQRKLEQMGLSHDITQQRLAALSNQEVASLAGKIDAMPAAGDLGFQEMVIILLVAILVVLAV